MQRYVCQTKEKCTVTASWCFEALFLLTQVLFFSMISVAQEYKVSVISLVKLHQMFVFEGS